eukprot:6177532-Pleurochrysis_carterae.AAC.1
MNRNETATTETGSMVEERGDDTSSIQVKGMLLRRCNSISGSGIGGGGGGGGGGCGDGDGDGREGAGDSSVCCVNFSSSVLVKPFCCSVGRVGVYAHDSVDLAGSRPAR